VEKNYTNLKENSFPYKDACSAIYIYIEREREREREREYKEGILFEFLIKMMSLMGLIELIMIELGWDRMLNDKKEKKRKASRATKCRIYEKKIE